MSKLFLPVALFLLFSLLSVSCGSKKTDAGKEEKIVAASISGDNDSQNNYSDISFQKESDVIEFLQFKRFSDRGSLIAFNGKGGTLDGETFVISDVEIVNPKSVKIFINIPSVKMTGYFILNNEDGKISLLDPDTQIAYTQIQPEK